MVPRTNHGSEMKHRALRAFAFSPVSMMRRMSASAILEGLLRVREASMAGQQSPGIGGHSKCGLDSAGGIPYTRGRSSVAIDGRARPDREIRSSNCQLSYRF